MAFDTVGCEMPSRFAVLANEPVSTTRAKIAQASRSGKAGMVKSEKVEIQAPDLTLRNSNQFSIAAAVSRDADPGATPGF
ncbi:hypothetical protein BGC_48850 [Burkholderia sp. 3C]